MTQKINRRVWKLISQDFSVQKDLVRGLINMRALAKHLISEYRLDATIDAVVSAIRRYDAFEISPEFRVEIGQLLSGVGVFTRDKVACVTVHAYALKSMFENHKSDDIKSNYRILKGKTSALIFCNEDEAEKVASCFSKDKLVDIRKGLSEILLFFPEDGRKIKGVLSRIFNELSLRGVSIADFIQCYPEVIFYVEKKALLDAHHVVLTLIDGAKKK